MKKFLCTVLLAPSAPLTAFAADNPNILWIVAEDIGLDYARYHYRCDKDKGSLRVELSAKAQDIELELLLPEGRQARVVMPNGREVALVQKQVEQSRYVCLKLEGTQSQTVEVQLR